MKLVIKGLVAAVLLWVVLRTVDAVAIVALLAGLDPVWALAALAATALMIATDAVLFAGSMENLGRRLPFDVSLLYCLVGWFFSNLAPSTVGGDIFRGTQMARLGTPIGVAVRALLSMRILSLASLFAVMLAGFPQALGLMKSDRDIVALSLLMVATAGALLAFPLLTLIPARLLGRWRVLRDLTAVLGDFRGFLVPSATAAITWLAATVQHILRIVVLACLAVGLGLDIPLATLFALTPVAMLTAMVPVSLGSWGIREAAFVYFLGSAGVSAEAALSLSLSFGFLRVVVGAIGGLVWVLADHDRFRVDPPAD